MFSFVTYSFQLTFLYSYWDVYSGCGTLQLCGVNFLFCKKAIFTAVVTSCDQIDVGKMKKRESFKDKEQGGE